MKEDLAKIRTEALSALEGTRSAGDLDGLRVKYLGKKGELTAVLKQMGALSAEERPVIGQIANDVREALETAIAARQKALEEEAMNARLSLEKLDVTIPGTKVVMGHKHPMSLVLDEMKDIFIGMGFTIAEGPEVELADYNFTKLNAPEGHPSRDWSDTFYLKEDSSLLLRSQTSPV
ncbi:MAG: phenylalanine--tRNA ligase subunit alpha, partial [Oscillospiraceae bacterium]